MNIQSAGITDHTALLYTMVLASACDTRMTDKELYTIGEVVKTLPIFEDFDTDFMVQQAEDCAELLDRDNGLEVVLELVKSALAPRLRETAYAVALEVVAADGEVSQEELRFLELLRHELDIDRLIAAGIERGTRARYMR